MASSFEGNVIVTSVKEPSYGILETDVTNNIINDILGKCRVESENIINNNLELLKNLTLSLIENKKLNSEEIYNISREYYPNLKVEETSHVIGEDYIGILNKKFSEL